MKCPDCGAEIGRFQAETEPTAEYNSIKCLVTGRRILLPTGPEIPKQPSRKQWKRKRNAQAELAAAKKKKKKQHTEEPELVGSYG